MFKFTLTTLSAVLVAVICFHSTVEASGKGKTGSSNARTATTSSFNTSRVNVINNNVINSNVINNNVVNRSNTSFNTLKSSNITTNNKTSSTSLSLTANKSVSSSCVPHGSCCGWWGSWFGCCYPGYCYSYCGWYRPCYWWCCDYTPLLIVEVIPDGQPVTGPTPGGDVNPNPAQVLEPTPPAKTAPGGM
jgi:hypothetical protein